MKIFIKNIKGEAFEIECSLEETILQTKQKIQQIKKLDLETQKLIFKGIVTSDENCLKELGVKENEFMVLLISKKIEKKINIVNETSELKKISSDDSKPTTPNSQLNSTSNEGGLVFGEAFEQTIENMTSMGFQKSDVIRALHAAYHNPDRALDFLFNGIPDIHMMEQNLAGNIARTSRAANEDELAIDRLSSLGFSKEKASSAYYASGKNENLAANILLFNQDNDQDVPDNENDEN